MYQIVFAGTARKDIEELKQSGDNGALKKFEKLLEELMEHPQVGTGKPEQMKHEMSGKWSRRLTQKHRIVYAIDEANKTVTLSSAQKHYGAK